MITSTCKSGALALFLASTLAAASGTYQTVENWAQFPQGMTKWGAATGVEVDAHDNVYVFQRTPNYACPLRNSRISDEEQAAIKARQGVRYPVLEGLMVADEKTLKPVPSDGKTIGFTIANNAFTAFSLTYNAAACGTSGGVNITYTTPLPISGSSFTISSQGAPPVRIAFLGCGFITRVHARHLQAMRSEIELAFASGWEMP